MKHFLALLSAALLGIAAFSHQNTSTLSGKVTDENGDSIWQKTYPLEAVGVGEFNIFWSLFAMPDGNFLATGLSEDNIGFIMKFTGAGDTVWTKALPYNIQGESFYYTPDGKLWLAGQTNHNTENGGMMADASLIRIDYANLISLII